MLLKKKYILFYKILIIITIVLFFTFILSIFSKEHFYGINDEKSYTDIFFNRFYLVSTTLSTVGYGDISPSTVQTRIIIIILQFLIMLFILNHINF